MYEFRPRRPARRLRRWALGGLLVLAWPWGLGRPLRAAPSLPPGRSLTAEDSDIRGLYLGWLHLPDGGRGAALPAAPAAAGWFRHECLRLRSAHLRQRAGFFHHEDDHGADPAPRWLSPSSHRQCHHQRRLASGLCLLLGSHSDGARLLRCCWAAHFFRSLQYTCLNTLAYADIDDDKMSAATSFSSMMQQLSNGMGVAVGAILLHAMLSFRGASPAELSVGDVQIAFVAVTLLCLLWPALLLRLPPGRGGRSERPSPASPPRQSWKRGPPPIRFPLGQLGFSAESDSSPARARRILSGSISCRFRVRLLPGLALPFLASFAPGIGSCRRSGYCRRDGEGPGRRP